jgi:protein-S-isoprenylcysteine O-methyltransferase Ste14
VTLLRWIAAVVLFLQLPIPLYWFVLHPQVRFWRTRQKAAYITGFLCSWPPVTAAMIFWRRELFRFTPPAAAEVALGSALIIFEGWIFWRVHKDLGTDRLVGKTELSGGGGIETGGIYGVIRHPRYTGSFLAILGACCLAGNRVMWSVAGIWLVLTLVAIAMEERELSGRFGVEYTEYCRRIPRFLP